jgi:uncharacterized membrane protein YebE (DUF533 family)
MGGRKRSRHAARFLSGRKGFLSASTLLAAAGVAWGVYDSLKAGAAGAAPLPPAPHREVLRLVRLAVSAARADGTLSAEERAIILQHAQQAGLHEVVEEELARPQPLSAILDGVMETERRRDLYVLAFTIVRADESVTGAEQIYLAQLAHQLRLDPAAVAELERVTAAKIDGTSGSTGPDSQNPEE